MPTATREPLVAVAAQSGYKYVRTKNRLHRVHVAGNQTWKVEQCNLDDATYLGLDDEPTEGIAHCAYCWRGASEESLDEAEQAKRGESTVPALSKRQVPRSLVLLPRRLFVALVLVLALAALLAGNVSGVVLSPDDDPRPSPTIGPPAPTPCLDVLLCGDLERYVQDLVDRALADHILSEHLTSPAPSSSAPTPTTTPGNTSPGGSGPNPTPRPTPLPTPRRTPTPTARPVPTVRPSPEPTPCFRPGNPHSGHDPCSWPVDD